ncbi:MAG: TRAP transporter small permease [Phycisphaerales bacterium]|nr:MAG: TRAP transporter small permease [Phycisphaerales bacterium]
MDKFFGIVEKLLHAVIGTIFGLLAAVTFLQVILRYVFHAPVIWADEWLRFTFVWGVLLAVTLGIKDGSHIALDHLLDKAPNWLKHGFQLIVASGIILFSAAIIYEGLLITRDVAATKSPAMRISLGYLYAAVPVSAVFWLLYAVKNLIAVFMTVYTFEETSEPVVPAQSPDRP